MTRAVLAGAIAAVPFLAAPGASDSSQDAAEHHEAGVAAHLQRCLDDAAREYDATLALDPPKPPSAEERARILRLAPRIFANRAEPFPLQDAAAIVHPSRPLIAYHLFWGDDVDFPDDNDPTDHEVIWVQYAPDGSPAAISTLFHGRIVTGGAEAIDDARANGLRPRVDVQWGKHGPMPAGWRQLKVQTEDGDTDTAIPARREMSLLEYNQLTWKKLSTVGTRQRNHPLAVRYGWPGKFDGGESAFLAFSREIDIRPLLERRTMMLVSRWNSASLSRHLLFYNFRPKLEWPD